MYKLNSYSKRIHVPNINISLFCHQEAMLAKMIELEQTIGKTGNNGIFIMNDPPGSGKSFAILALILLEKRFFKKTQNLLIVPLNIHNQWIQYIKTFSNSLTVHSFIEYHQITSLYYDTSILSSFDILITTSVFYPTISQISNQMNIQFNRVILDEIDSISFFTHQETINSNYIWLVSASANLYKSNTNYKNPNYKDVFNSAINNFHHYVECEKSFIENSIQLPPIIYHKFICSNPNQAVLNSLLSQNDMNSVNAMDYSNFVFNFLSNAKTITNTTDLLSNFIKDYLSNIKHLEESIKNQFDKIPNNNYYKILFLFMEYLKQFTNKKPIAKIMKFGLKTIQDSICIVDFLDELKKEFINFQNDLHEKDLQDELNEKSKTFYDSLILAQKYHQLQKIQPESDVDLKEKQIIKSLIDSIQKNWNKIIEIQTKIDFIMERISENDCPICLEDMSSIKKIVFKCCQNVFCIDCTRELCLVANKCPKCRHEIDEELILVLDTDLQKQLEKDLEKEKQLKLEHDEIKLDHQVDKIYKDKNEAFCDIIQKIITQPIYNLLIFSDFEGTFGYIRKYLQEKNISFDELDGSIHDIDEKIHKYKNTRGRNGNGILMIDSLHYGAGLNLENTTDIIMVHMTKRKQQIIGRAQRIGRTQSLNVYEILYNNESILIQFN